MCFFISLVYVLFFLLLIYIPRFVQRQHNSFIWLPVNFLVCQCYNLVLGVTLLYSLKGQSMIIVYLSLSLGMFLNNEFCQVANSEIFLAGIK